MNLYIICINIYSAIVRFYLHVAISIVWLNLPHNFKAIKFKLKQVRTQEGIGTDMFAYFSLRNQDKGCTQWRWSVVVLLQ